ncbi:hypothetical protein DFH07DRAFT_519480 [Mycena maculata]|uniref:F-box domain-containing protein n=1 Tax=Mycena maculata TaxID=230809 RepID=A0AAD7IXV8_9AGAR|nr:hypothetical protein DFH07DRAFT_519480 [Mycena maculata]
MSESLADLRRRRARLDALILDQEAVVQEQHARLKELDETRNEIQKQLDLVVYPILTLPHEITSDIFVHCLPSGAYAIRLKNPSQAPVLLLNVCKTWRSIAISTPRLWANLTVNFTTQSWDHSKLLARIDGWLSRAGSCPLSLTVAKFDFSMASGLTPSTPLSYAIRIDFSV